MPPEEVVDNQEEVVVDDNVDDNQDDASGNDDTNDDAASGEDSPEDIAEAKRIYKLLKDPKTATTLVRELARAEGLLKEDAPTRTEIKEGKKAIKDILKEKLGSKYEFLIGDLGDALEAILEGERAESQQSVQQIQIDATKRETADVLSKLARETKGESRKLEPQMLALMEEFQIGPGVPIEKYLRGLYHQASAARTANKNKTNQNDKINRNANDAPSRLQTSSGAESRDGKGAAGVDPNKKMSLKEAVQFAVGEQTRQSTRK